MNRVAVRLAGTMAVLVASACAIPAWIRPQPSESPPPPEVMAEARELYLRDCAPCHGETGRGDGPECAALRLPPADLTRLTAAHGGTLPREYFVDVVTGKIDVPAHGTCEMPVWRRRFGPSDSGPAAVAAIHTERRLDLLAAYVRSLQRPAPGRR